MLVSRKVVCPIDGLRCKGVSRRLFEVQNERRRKEKINFQSNQEFVKFYKIRDYTLLLKRILKFLYTYHSILEKVSERPK